ncbi:hypothetical protein [Flavonifractor sp. An112]|nr:hypothetical protein [Flavonifractor sp. An112]
MVWANESSAKTAPKSALGKALHYLGEQWPYLVRYPGAALHGQGAPLRVG